MPWYYLAIISIIGVSLANLLARVLMKEKNSNPISYAIVFQFLVGFISLGFTLLLNKFVLPTDLNLLPRFLTSAFLWAGMTVFSFKATKTLTAGEITILGTSGTVISIVLGVFILGETLKTSGVMGILLILAAVLIINSEKLSFVSKQGIIFALLSAVCGGIAVVNDAIILKSYEAFSYMAVISLLPGLILLLLFPKQFFASKKLFNAKRLKLMSILGIFYSIQGIAFYLAFQKGAPVSLLSPLTRLSIVLTVLLGAIFLKEKRNLSKKILAAIIAMTGAILVG